MDTANGHPWRNATAADLEDEGGALPAVIGLSPDDGAALPLWGDGGNISWQRTGFSLALLDRLAAWQQAFDEHFHRKLGWRSAEARHAWAAEARLLEEVVRAELGEHSQLMVDLWPLSR